MITIDRAIDIIAERTYQNTLDINRKNLQRRHQVVDLYGVSYTAQGDATHPARIYLAISPDMEYLERFQFKLIVGSFISTIGTFSASGGGNVGDTSLSVGSSISETLISGNRYKLGFDNPMSINPNPHNHSLGSLEIENTPGITPVPTISTDFRVIFFDPETDPNAENGVDISGLLASQYGGAWISGEGTYPSLKIDEDYDILQVACELEGAGYSEYRKLLTDPGRKGIEIISDAPFSVTLENYLKYSHMNR